MKAKYQSVERVYKLRLWDVREAVEKDYVAVKSI